MLKSVLKILLQFLFRIKVVGEYKDQNGHTIIIANHQSFLDGLILGVMLPVSPVFVVNTQIAQRPLLRLIMSMGEYLVVDPSSPMAIKAVIKLVQNGRPVVIFPEGRITTTGSLMKIYEGSAFVAAKTAATILPVIIHGGTFSALSRMHQDHPTRWFPRITLTYCQPSTLQIADHLSGHDHRYKAGEEMRLLLQRSLFESRPRSNLFEAFVASASLFGKSHKILEDTEQIEYTYRQVLTMSLELGRLLSRLTAPHEAIGIFMPTAVPTLALIFGLSAMGRIPAILNFTTDVEELQSACDGALLKIIISSKAFIEETKLESKLAALKNVRIVYLEDLKPTMSLMDKLWLMGYAIHFPRAATVPCDPSSPAVVLFTS
ncbi:MAG: acyl-[acyl-carrier-protein]-phospholipid O-acyltransferase, partial [Campylobacterota bacterium]|nr:acyl-[acyl-carrier-protein]-phospholipid O-acyltransferase [Campylobacterota bacterium]